MSFFEKWLRGLLPQQGQQSAAGSAPDGANPAPRPSWSEVILPVETITGPQTPLLFQPPVEQITQVDQPKKVLAEVPLAGGMETFSAELTAFTDHLYHVVYTDHAGVAHGAWLPPGNLHPRP